MWRSIGAWSASLCENRTLGSRIISRIGLTSERANISRFYQSRVAFLSIFLFFFFLGEIEVHLHRSRVTTGILSCSSLGQTRCFTHTFPVSCPLDFAGRVCVCVCVCRRRASDPLTSVRQPYGTATISRIRVCAWHVVALRSRVHRPLLGTFSLACARRTKSVGECLNLS